jgi:hypothetical protein
VLLPSVLSLTLVLLLSRSLYRSLTAVLDYAGATNASATNGRVVSNASARESAR